MTSPPPVYRVWLRLCAVWLVSSLAAVLLVWSIDSSAADIEACAAYGVVAAGCLVALPPIVVVTVRLGLRILENLFATSRTSSRSRTRAPSKKIARPTTIQAT
ncbi:MAG: hypothetical protein JO128_07450 [Alphaproteobacteria bacterium]|nr:hypothetical protein [Alphaproteobacteria bacterium]